MLAILIKTSRRTIFNRVGLFGYVEPIPCKFGSNVNIYFVTKLYLMKWLYKSTYLSVALQIKSNFYSTEPISMSLNVYNDKIGSFLTISENRNI